MKKLVYPAIILSIVAIFATSCKKEENTNGSNAKFIAKIESDNNAKTTLASSGKLSWDENDPVEIYWDAFSYTDPTTNTTTNYDAANCTYAATPVSGNADILAYLLPQDETLPHTNYNGSFYAIYPNSIAGSKNTITLPATIQSNGSLESLKDFPMYAKSDNGNKTLTFKNLCSVLKLTLQKNNATVSKIQIVADKYLNGTFTVDWNDGDPTLTPTNNVVNHKKVTTLDLGGDVSISSSTDFYIYLPAGEYYYFQIKVYGKNSSTETVTSCFTKTYRNTTTPLSLPRSHRCDATLNSITFNPGDLNGNFTVSRTGGTPHKVSFSRGNLLYVNSSYKFADNQYDHKEGTSPSYDTWLYQWGSSSSATTMNQRWTSGIINGGGSTWRCLTQSEWDYLLRLRSSNGYMDYYNKNGERVQTTISQDNARGFTLCKIGNARGLLIFPDLFYWPLDNKEPTQFGQGNYGTSWNNIFSLTTDEWKIVEGAGAVFLPTTGYKWGTHAFTNETTQGAYWSSYYNSTLDRVNRLLFSSTATAFSDNQTSDRYADYCAIRLVKDI